MNKQHNDQYWNFLEGLRQNSATNKFGTTPYLLETFDELHGNKRTAQNILMSWMKHYGEEYETILDYDDFEVYKTKDGKYWYLHDGVAKEVELNLAVLIPDDVDDEDLIGAYESDVCGEGEGDRCGKYYYFSRKHVIECLNPNLNLKQVE